MLEQATIVVTIQGFFGEAERVKDEIITHLKKHPRYSGGQSIAFSFGDKTLVVNGDNKPIRLVKVETKTEDLLRFMMRVLGDIEVLRKSSVFGVTPKVFEGDMYIT